MANIERRQGKNGRISYRALVRLKGHPAESATFSRLTDAKRWASATESAIREGRYFKTSEAKKRTLSDLIGRYMEEVLPNKPRSAYEQRYQLEWWRKELGAYVLADVSPALLTQAKDKLARTATKAGAERSPATVNRYLAALSHAFSVAAKEWHWIEGNPLRNVSRPREPRGRDRFLDKDEIRRLLEACEQSNYSHLATITLLALSTGMRRGEILGLRRQDVDLESKCIHLVETKNGDRRRVPLTGVVEKRLKELLIRRQSEELLFPSVRDKSKPIKIDAYFKQAVKDADIKNFTFHDTRHTAASYLTMTGASLPEIAHILGHKTLAMVKRYAHLSDDHTSKVVARMNEELFQ